MASRLKSLNKASHLIFFCLIPSPVHRGHISFLQSHAEADTMSDINAIAKQFTDFYYRTFNSDRSSLHNLYVCWVLVLTLISPSNTSALARSLYVDFRGPAHPGCFSHNWEARGEHLPFPCIRYNPEPNILKSLPFSKTQHKITTLDAQPSSTSAASLIVFVTGLLVVRQDTRHCVFYPLIPDIEYYLMRSRSMTVKTLSNSVRSSSLYPMPVPTMCRITFFRRL